MELRLHFNHVTKTFPVPNGKLGELLDVYITLKKLDMPDVIRCNHFIVGGLGMFDFTCVSLHGT